MRKFLCFVLTLILSVSMLAFVAGCDNDDKGGDGDVISPDVTTVEDFKKCVTDTLALKEFEISLNIGQYSEVETLSNIGGDNMYYSLTSIENGVNRRSILYRDGYLYLEREEVKLLTSGADAEKFIIGKQGIFFISRFFLCLLWTIFLTFHSLKQMSSQQRWQMGIHLF